MGQVQTMVPRYLKVLEYFLSQAHNLAITIQFSELDLTQNNLPYHTYGCDVHFVDAHLPGSRGSTPLLLACHAINPATVLLLLQYGAAPAVVGAAPPHHWPPVPIPSVCSSHQVECICVLVVASPASRCNPERTIHEDPQSPSRRHLTVPALLLSGCH